MVQFLRFVAVGAVNTSIGLGVIFATMTLLGWGPFAANVLGYAVGLSASFVLNGMFAFRVGAMSPVMWARFMAVIAPSYVANLLAVWLLLPLGATVAQIGGAAAYTLLSFVGCRRFVYRPA